MPRKIVVNPDDWLMGELNGTQLYARPTDHISPLYQNVKLINRSAPLFAMRRTAYLVWIIHQARFRRGGDGWQVAQSVPHLHAWAAQECAKEFTPQYVMDLQGLSLEEYQSMTATEEEKYGA